MSGNRNEVRKNRKYTSNFYPEDIEELCEEKEGECVGEFGISKHHPSYIFIGGESSGKSSLVCGLLGEPIVDISSNVCTRVPTFLSIEPFIPVDNSLNNQAKVSIKYRNRNIHIQLIQELTGSEIIHNYSGFLNICKAWRASQIINCKIRESETGTDRTPLYIRVKTPEFGKNPFTFIDMPGYIGYNGEKVYSDKVMRMNRDFVKKNVIEPKDSKMVCCVCVEATHANSQMNQYKGIIGVSPKARKCERLIFVFSKCDLFFQKDRIESLLEILDPPSHKGLWDYFTRDILRTYKNAEFFFSIALPLQGILFDPRRDDRYIYRKSKLFLMKELEESKKSRTYQKMKFLRDLPKLFPGRFSRNQRFLNMFKERFGLRKFQDRIKQYGLSENSHERKDE